MTLTDVVAAGELSAAEAHDLEALEAQCAAGLLSFGRALRAIHDDPRKLYRCVGTWADYVAERFGISVRHAGRIIAAVNAYEALQLIGPLGPIPADERTLRPLVPLLRDRSGLAEVWDDLQERYGGQLTGELVRDAVDKYLRRKKAREQPEEEARSGGVEAERYTLLWASIADAAGHIARESVDIIITDPPYPREYLPLYSDLSALAEHALKPGGLLLALSGQSYLPEIVRRLTEKLAYLWTVAYLTPGGQAVQVWDRHVNTFWKPVLCFVKGASPAQWVGDVVSSDVNDNDKRFHDWGQSESGIARLVERFSKPDDLVLDPFLGGGTTGVACLQLGRRFLGIDTDQAAVARSAARLAAVETELT